MQFGFLSGQPARRESGVATTLDAVAGSGQAHEGPLTGG
jgi:hypothetical protein